MDEKAQDLYQAYRSCAILKMVGAIMNNLIKLRKHNKLESFFDTGNSLAYTLLVPSLVVIFGVMLYPILYSFVISFSEVVFSNNTITFVGLKNYIEMFSDTYFLNSIGITVYFSIVTVAAEIVLGIGMAMVLNQEFRGRGFVRGIMILPWALPSVVNAIMWKWIYDSNYGALNAALSQLHLIDGYQLWLSDPASALNLMIYANIWKETPYVVLLTIAALSNIPSELYESARVDGANSWVAFWRITLPMIRPVVLILAITKTIWALQTFELVLILTGGGPANGTQLITFFIHKNTFKFQDFGYGSAMAYFLTIITFVLSFIYIKFLSKDGEVI